MPRAGRRRSARSRGSESASPPSLRFGRHARRRSRALPAAAKRRPRRCATRRACSRCAEATRARDLRRSRERVSRLERGAELRALGFGLSSLRGPRLRLELALKLVRGAAFFARTALALVEQVGGAGRRRRGRLGAKLRLE